MTLALVAVLGQAIIAALPMPGTSQAVQGMHECAADAAGGAPLDQTTGKSPYRPVPSCPVCQAMFLAANLLPPTVPLIDVGPSDTEMPATPKAAAFVVAPTFRPQSARAPPSLI